MDISSNISFRNYFFEEHDNYLIISKKNQNPKEIDFLKLVQKETCSHLFERYQEHLVQKQEDLEQFHPRFVSEEAQQAFKSWQERQITQIVQKLENPLEALQKKVAKRSDQLFQEKGQRTVMLGCCHVKTNLLTQTQTPFIGPHPQSTLEQEDHTHEHHVCLDWKTDALENIEFNLCGNPMAKPNFPDITANGPDFSRRWFEFEHQMQDFAFLKDLQSVHAERIPLLERGIYEDSISLIKQIFNWLTPGGTFSFDVGTSIYLSSPSYPLDFDQECTKRALNDSLPERIQELGEAVAQEVFADKEYIEFVNFALNNVIEITEGSLQDVAGDIFNKEINRRLRLEIEKEYYEKERALAKEFTRHHPDKVTLKPENIEMIFFGEGNLSTIKFSLKDVREGLADEALQACNQREPKRIETMRVRIHEDSDIPFEELFAINRQIECYNALHVNPQLIEEILPQNKQLLDEMLEILGRMICHHLEVFGFVNAKFDLNIPHPENKRLFSRIISVQKPAMQGSSSNSV